MIDARIKKYLDKVNLMRKLHHVFKKLKQNKNEIPNEIKVKMKFTGHKARPVQIRTTTRMRKGGDADKQLFVEQLFVSLCKQQVLLAQDSV